MVKSVHKIATNTPITQGGKALNTLICGEFKRYGIAVCECETMTEGKKKDAWGLIVNTKNQRYENDIIDQCIQLKTCKRILIIHIGEFEKPWENASQELKTYLDDFVRPYNITEFYKCVNDIKNSSSNSIPDYKKETCGQYFYAKKIYKLLAIFGHSGQSDITNTYLGPARMLLISEQPIPDDVAPAPEFASFIEAVKSCGHLGGRLGETWGNINKLGSIKERSKEGREDLISCMEIMMNLLTECRAIAGEHPVNQTKSTDVEVKVLPIPESPVVNKGNVYRILVIDDHAKYWRHVFVEVQKGLKKKDKETIIHFSKDAANVQVSDSQPLPLVNCIADYDAVLLDIYIPEASVSFSKQDNGLESKGRGLKILEEIRKRCGWIPVIIWTSSLSHELAAEASISNGYLFKKTATCDDIANTLNQWLASGASRRRMSLPNPFFDYVLQTEKIRQLAVDFTDWCLKHIDSFHALDDRYFKFFNDHGGRHITKVMDIIDKLIRPFLFTGSGIAGDMSGDALFSDIHEEREKEIFYLYLAILCHELGMFPMKRDGELEDYSVLAIGDLNIRRTLHAVRSMLIIAKDLHQSPAFNDLVKRLDELVNKKGRYCAAILAGYHSRFLNLESHFLCTDGGDWKKNSLKNVPSEEIEKIKSEIGEVFKSTKDELTDDTDRTRLKKMSAILRFADAIDIDKTRVPADFLLYHAARDSFQDTENLKRMVVEKIVVDQGTVFVEFNAALPTGTSCRYFNETICSQLESEKKYAIVTDDEAEQIGNLLKQYFRKRDEGVFPMSYDMSYDCAKYLAALSVLYEINDEYRAIKESGLHTHIKLGRVSWADPKGGEKNEFFIRTDINKYKFSGCDRDLTKDDKSLIASAFDVLLREARRHVDQTLSLKIEPISGGKSGAKTFIIRCEPYQPRFCKIDNFDKIEKEYKGIKNIASLHIPARNLAGDVHISKYIDKGLLMGSLLLDHNPEDEGKGFQLLEDYLVKNDNVNAQDIFEPIFSEIIKEGPSTDIKAHILYEQEIKKVDDTLKEKEIELFEKINQKDKEMLCVIKEKWLSVYDTLWNKFKELLNSRELTRSFVHGDLQPLNILIEPGRSDSSRFILIDTASCAYNHRYRDAAIFDMYLKTTFIRVFVQTKKEKSSYKEATERAETLRKSLKKYAVKNGEKEKTEFTIACLMRHFLFLLFWLDEVDDDRLFPMIYDVWDELYKLLKQIGISIEPDKEFMDCLKKACNPESTTA